MILVLIERPKGTTPRQPKLSESSITTAATASTTIAAAPGAMWTAVDPGWPLAAVAAFRASRLRWRKAGLLRP
jgi:hypothetical protein